MKNLIDELHELDNYEYKVSKDFSKNVMKAIKKEKNKFNYAISIASVGIVACFALIAVTNANFKSNIFNFVTESADNYAQVDVTENEVNYDLADEIKSDDSILSDFAFTPQVDNTNGTVMQEAMGTKAPSIASDSTSNNKMEEIVAEKDSVQNSLASDLLREDEKIDEIVNTLKKAGIDMKVDDGEIEVEVTKEKVEKILEAFENIEIIEEGKIVIIKVK